MADIVEIRWHGRGGQGAKTASLLLADAAFNTGKYVQGFPEYGPERMGAPITAYNRISKEQGSCLTGQLFCYLLPTAFSAISSIDFTDCGHSGCAIGKTWCILRSPSLLAS